jgi:hypothetical protein
MSAPAIALIVFACVFGGAVIGMALGAVLPPQHLTSETKDVVKLAMAMIATMAALVLGLLTSSAKSAFDTTSSEVQQSAANVLMLDRVLAAYGPETHDLREGIRQGLTARIDLTWPPDGHAPAPLDSPQTAPTVDRIDDAVRRLTPQNDTQRGLQARALQLTSDLLRTRWLVLGSSAGSAIPTPFLIVVVFWLATIFASFGLFAPRNATVLGALFVCALSVAGSIFLILEMDTPLSGLLKISPAPLRFALSHLGQ